MSAAHMIATHMNSPYGPVVCEQDVVDSLRSGRFQGKGEIAAAILEAIFLENEPGLILRAAQEVSATQEALQQLYRESVRLTHMRCERWEQATKDWS